MEKNSTLRILYLCKILYEYTDEDHPLSTTELMSLMEEQYGFPGHRTTISADIKTLKKFGVDIYTIESTQNKYFICTRLFDIPELKLMIDAVESSKFITASKSKQLVEKIGKLACAAKADELKRNLCTKGRIKPENEHIYYIVDTINEAINKGKKISFQYYQYNVRKKQQLKHNGEEYVFSPYTLVWNGDYYYVVGYSDKHGDLGSYRVDRINKSPKILRDNAVPAPDDFNISEYIKTMFRMFNSESKEVELICDNSLMDAMIDRFGTDVKTYAYNLTSFRLVAEVAINHVFFSWVFGFGGKVKINAPDDVKKQYSDMVKQAAESVEF